MQVNDLYPKHFPLCLPSSDFFLEHYQTSVDEFFYDNFDWDGLSNHYDPMLNFEDIGMSREIGLGEMEDEKELEDIQNYVATMVKPSLPIVSMWDLYDQAKNSQSQKSKVTPKI